MRHTVGDGSPHAVEPIHQIAVVVIPVPKVEDEQNNQRSHEYAHLTSLLPASEFADQRSEGKMTAAAWRCDGQVLEEHPSGGRVGPRQGGILHARSGPD
jgi:hypothetical protein